MKLSSTHRGNASGPLYSFLFVRKNWQKENSQVKLKDIRFKDNSDPNLSVYQFKSAMAYTSQEKLPGHLPRPIQILICLPNCFSHGTYIVKATFRWTYMAFISKTIQILTYQFYQFSSVIAHTHTKEKSRPSMHLSSILDDTITL